METFNEAMHVRMELLKDRGYDVESAQRCWEFIRGGDDVKKLEPASGRLADGVYLIDTKGNAVPCIFLDTSDEEQSPPWEEDIKNVDALPITADLLKGFGFEVGRMSDDRGTPYQEVEYKGKYVGALYYYREEKAYLYVCRHNCMFMHELIAYNHRNNIHMNLEWKGEE